MGEGFICKSYRFDKTVFSGVFLMPEGFLPQKVYFKDIKNDRYCYDISCEPGNGKDEYYISADCDGAAFLSGTWHPVVEGSDGTQHFFFYRDMKNEKKHGRMLKLSKDTLFFDAKERYHYMAAIDAGSHFSIRKWRNKAKTVNKTKVYIKDYVRDGMKVRFDLTEDDRLKCTNQAEMWLWNKKIKEVYRITIDPDDVDNYSFEIDFSDFYHRYGKQILKQWDVFLVCNREGSYFQSWIILKDRKKYAHSIALQGSDDSDRYIFNEPYTGPDGTEESAFQMFFDSMLRLCIRTVPSVYMYRNVYRECIESFSMKKGILNIRILCRDFKFSKRKLVIRHRADEYVEASQEDSQEDSSEDLREDSRKEAQEDSYEYEPTSVESTDDGDLLTFNVDCAAVKWAPPRYEILLIGIKDKNEYEFRLVGEGPAFDKNLTSVYKYMYTTDDGCLVYLTRTISGKIVMECRQKSRYDSGRYRINEKIASAIYAVTKRFYRSKKNFLFFEKFCTAAQDNAYYMFEYFVQKANEKIRPLYIIEKDRPAYRELKSKYGRKIIDFMSIRHLIYLQAADLFISTDSKRHGYKWNAGSTKFLDMLKDKKSVFLQHGVVAFKKVDNIYGKQYVNRADMFIASSEAEKETILRYFGYDKKEVVVTGLARWDKLVSSPKKPPEIFYMPTWRSWITELNEKEFVKTDYFKAYETILNSDKTAEILEKYDLHMTFCFHPKFRDYMHCIDADNPRIKMAGYDDVRINDLLMGCSMFITDYSSAAWDVYYMNKPVLFYQFDYEEYNKKQGSYINMERGIASDRVTDFGSFIRKFNEIAEGGFKGNVGDNRMISEHLPAHRGGHRKKIYDEIIKRFV